MPEKPPESPDSPLRRAGSRREPATIDLPATEVRSDADAAAPPETPPAELSPTEDIASASPAQDGTVPSDNGRAAEPDMSSTATGSRSSVPPISPGETQRRGFGFPSLLAASILGGLLGAGATLLAETWWRPRVSQVDARLAQVEQRVAAAPQAGLAPLEGRLARLETDSKTVADRLNAAQALAERGAKDAQEALKQARTPPAPAPDTNAASASVLADIATRLGALEKQVQERTQTAAAVQERIASVQERTQAAATSAQALERRIADQDQRLAALAKQFSERGPDAMAASLRVTLADRLADALQDGAPVGQILSMLRRLDVKPDAIRSLEVYAQNGPPSAATLAQEFRPLGQRMIAETRASSADWGDRLSRMLDKVVTVRAVGDPQSTDVANIVARIEDALGREAVGEAAAAWNVLPEPARRVAPEWGAKLQQRAAAEAAAQKIYSEALSGLEATTR